MNIVNCSGGKDSTAMLVMMLEKGISVNRILYADVGDMAEFHQMYDYISKVEAYTGRTIETVRSNRWTARSIFYGYPARGKYTNEIRGFPLTIGSACRYRTWLKVEPLENAIGWGHDVYIGIAADEAERSRCKEYTKGKNRYHFPLVEWGVTEQQCLEYLQSIGLYNPLYNYFNRLGCFWCPKQPIDSLRQLYRFFPDLWAVLKQMEEDQNRPFQYKRSVKDLEFRFQRELSDPSKYRRRYLYQCA